MEINRLETFSDGVFAVAITLLVLDLHVPASDRPLLSALADEWPQFAAFAISFAVIGIVWVNHHALFERSHAVDRAVLFLNLGLLMSVVLIPFATALFAAHLIEVQDAGTAGALFNGALLLMALGFSALHSRLGHRHVAGEAVVKPSRVEQLRFSAGVFVYAACLPLAFVSAPLVLALDGAVAIFYVADRLAAHDAG